MAKVPNKNYLKRIHVQALVSSGLRMLGLFLLFVITVYLQISSMFAKKTGKEMILHLKF